jgi:(S)-citramalyl-CoA lyase
MTPTPGGRGGAWLITPATASPARLDSLRATAADVTVLDLEDSVPHDRKDAARSAAITYLAADPGTGPVPGLRLNAPSTLPGVKDLVALAESGVRPAVLLIPMVESAREVDLVATVLELPAQRSPRVWALIETPRAIQNLPAILQSRFLAGVVFGAADYAAAAGCGRTGSALHYPRAALACAAAAAGVPAIDSPFFDLADPDGLSRESRQAKDLGFAGKGAVHPAQLPLIRAALRPTTEEVAAARAVLAAATLAHGAITTADGAMVGPPLIAAAHTVLTRAGDPTTPTLAGGSS